MKNQKKICPYCAEDIPVESIHCPFCGEKLPVDRTKIKDKKSLLIISLSVITIGLISFIFFNTDFSNFLNPNNLLQKGITLYKKGDYDESIKILEKQIEEDGDNYKAYYYLGKNYEEKNDRTEAIKYYKKVLQINPDFDEAKIPLVKLCIEDDDSGCVGEFIESAYHQDKKDPQLMFYYATHIIDKTERSIPLLKKVLEKEPNNYLANKYLGYYYSEKNDYKTAIPYLKKCLESKDNYLLHPELDSAYENTPKVEYMLARAYIEEDYYTNAIDLLNKVLSKNNDSTAQELKEEAQERKENYLYEKEQQNIEKRQRHQQNTKQKQNKNKKQSYNQSDETNGYTEHEYFCEGNNNSSNKVKSNISNNTFSTPSPTLSTPSSTSSTHQTTEPDFGPYMKELQRKIKLNWHPPKGQESKKVILLFKIAKNGQLLSCRVYKSSGSANVDQAALNAVKMTAPFQALPSGYKGTNIDIQFTFDYNVKYPPYQY